MRNIIHFGLKYNEASKCIFVWHATLSIIHVEREREGKTTGKQIPEGVQPIY